MKWLSPILLLALAGCPKKTPQTSSPAGALSALNEEMSSEPLLARFAVTVTTPDVDLTTAGTLLLAPPNQLRLEILTPLRTPAFLAVSDGQRIDAYATRGRKFYSGEDAVAVLTELTGGAMGIAELLMLLTGKLPMSAGEVRSQELRDDLIFIELAGPQDATLSAQVDASLGLIRQLEVFGAPTDTGALAPPLVTVGVPETMVLEGRPLPARLDISLPAIGWDLTLDIRSWNAMDPAAEAFALSAPKGVEQQDLVEALKEMATQRDAHPPP